MKALKCLSMSHREEKSHGTEMVFPSSSVFCGRGVRVQICLLALPQERHTSYMKFYKVLLNVLYGRCSWCGKGGGRNAKPHLKQFHTWNIVLSMENAAKCKQSRLSNFNFANPDRNS